MAGGNHPRSRPARHTNYSTELMTNVRGVHGHQGYCACGWVGLTWATPGKAQAEAKWHYWTNHQDEIAERRLEAVPSTGRAESS